MKIFRSLAVLLFVGIAISCTDNDEPLKLSELRLSYNGNSLHIPVNKEVEFSLQGDNYIDYTHQMTLMINGEAVDGNSITFDEVGEFDVQAKSNNKLSNTITFEVSKGLVVDRKSALKNQLVSFTLYDVASGEEITDNGVFYIDDEMIDGHSFSSDQSGDYEVYAEYTDADGDDQTTDVETFSVVAPTQRVLVEDYTGTWCGYCPRLQGVIEDLFELTDDAVAISLHASSSDIDPDPYAYEYIDDLVEEYNEYHQFPLGQINRTVTWTDNDPNTPLGYVGDESAIGIAAKTKRNGTQLNVDVRIASTQGFTNQKIVVAALENNLVHDQANYLDSDPDSQWYQAGNPIPNYVNDHVMRHAMTNVFGDPIPTTDPLNDYKKSFSMDLADYLNNPDDAEVVIFVLDDQGTVQQVKRVGINENSEFE